MTVELSRHELYRNLPPADRNSILIHDIRNMLSQPVLGAGILMQDRYLRRTRIPRVEQLGIDQMFDLHQRLLDIIGGVQYPEDGAPELVKLIKSTPARGELEGVIRDSVGYLDKLDDESYGRLRDREISLNTVCQAILGGSDPSCNIPVNGAQANVIFEEIGNAREKSRTYGNGDEQVDIWVTKNGVIIENNSRDPLQDDPFELRVTSKGLGHGYGLFIAAMYAEREGIRIIPSCESVEGGSKVRFTNQFTAQAAA